MKKLFRLMLRLVGIHIPGGPQYADQRMRRHQRLFIDREMATQLYSKIDTETSIKLTSSKTGETFYVQRVTAAR